jgi:adenylate cyclase
MIRRLYLITGLVLFGYLLTHLLNHALGLVSLGALDAGREAFLLLWRNPPMTLLLYGALSLHMGLALRALYRRRRLRMPAWEATQLILGFAIPPLLVLHVLGTRFAHEVLGVEDSYIYTLLFYFVFSPALGVKQVVVLLVAWLHACIGLHFWLRIRPWYAAAQPYGFAAALLLPAFSLAGFLAGGREVARLAADPDWLAAALARIRFADQEGVALVYDLEVKALFAMAAAFGLVLAARALRDWRDRRHGFFQVTYPGGRRVRVSAGTTLLEASRGAGIPHASVCGGRGRCSTCRVRVGAGADRLPPPSEAEARVLARIGAAPSTRLACQTRPLADLEITPLLAAAAGPRQAMVAARHQQGEEREVAVLFADLRGFTALAEARLPYDVVFVLNRYFAAMGTAIEESGGRVDKRRWGHGAVWRRPGYRDRLPGRPGGGAAHDRALGRTQPDARERPRPAAPDRYRDSQRAGHSG